MKMVEYEPQELWELFQKERDLLLTHTREIAENPDFDVMIFLTADEKGDNVILPTIIVWLENKEIYRESAVGENDLRRTAQDIYDEYLSDEKMMKRFFDEDQTEQTDEIEQREGELYDAASDFLFVVTGGKLEKLVGFAEAEKITADIVDRVCEYLHEECGVSVFRPMMLTDERQGVEFYEEFPYDCIVFEE